jgi:SAM-dependent methyltransferase
VHLNSQLAFRRHAIPYLSDGQVVLEIGPDGDPSTYRREVSHLRLDWQTADLTDDLLPATNAFRPATRPTYPMRDEYSIPIPDASVDAVVAGNVIEHVRKVWVWMEELARIARPGGRVIIVNPISWPHHAAPYDCWRIYPDGMRALCSHAGLAVELCEQVSLEPRRSRHTYFAESWEYLRASRRNALTGPFMAAVGWPMPTALDLITVATKPFPDASATAGP